MIKTNITISGTSKMNAAPAALLVQTASRFEARVHVEQKDKMINAKSIMGVMTLRISDGEIFTVVCEGSDEQNASDAIEKLLCGK